MLYNKENLRMGNIPKMWGLTQLLLVQDPLFKGKELRWFLQPYGKN
jgi:hypothetical protein